MVGPESGVDPPENFVLESPDLVVMYGFRGADALQAGIKSPGRKKGHGFGSLGKLLRGGRVDIDRVYGKAAQGGVRAVAAGLDLIYREDIKDGQPGIVQYVQPAAHGGDIPYPPVPCRAHGEKGQEQTDFFIFQVRVNIFQLYPPIRFSGRAARAKPGFIIQKHPEKAAPAAKGGYLMPNLNNRSATYRPSLEFFPSRLQCFVIEYSALTRFSPPWPSTWP